MTFFLLVGILLSFQSPFPEDFTLAWSTYLGGETSWDQARDIQTQALDNDWVTIWAIF